AKTINKWNLVLLRIRAVQDSFLSRIFVQTCCADGTQNRLKSRMERLNSRTEWSNSRMERLNSRTEWSNSRMERPNSRTECSNSRTERLNYRIECPKSRTGCCKSLMADNFGDTAKKNEKNEAEHLKVKKGQSIITVVRSKMVKSRII